MRLTASHVGYDCGPTTQVLLRGGDQPDVTVSAQIVGTGSFLPATIGAVEQAPGWTAGPWRVVTIDTSSLVGRACEVRVTVRAGEAPIVAETRFKIGPGLVAERTVSDVLYYFKSVRSSGEIDRKDSHALFYDDDPTRDDGPNGAVHEVDAHGGWLDASGDHSKFLSHLTYTAMMSPQQIPLCAWAMMAADESLKRTCPDLWPYLHARLRDEALFGADFLVRFQHPSGYFYTAIFDALTKQLDQRVITAPLQECVRTTRYQAAYRHGGGMAIAALARAARQDDHGEVDSKRYWDAAVAGLVHLDAHNTEYSFDGHESIIDDYCALMAACELEATWQAGVVDSWAPDTTSEQADSCAPATKSKDATLPENATASESAVSPEDVASASPDPGLWRRTATKRAESLMARYRPGSDEPIQTGSASDDARSGGAIGAAGACGEPGADGASGGSDAAGQWGDVGHLVGDAAGRPYFHAVESGLPVIALLRYSEIFSQLDPSTAERAADLAIQLCHDWLTRTHRVPNPFGYPRALVQPIGEAPRESFFYPHSNETGYWWQGENANICSLAAAANLVAQSERCPADVAGRLRQFAADQVSWVLGRNPFDVCMLHGQGENNREYSSHYPNVPGGILNGITAGAVDERDIDFLPTNPDLADDSWRWAEQWIPHAGWYLLAVATHAQQA